ncbi:hypothetical protein D5086_022280 [Populus alba]|uniref:Uncharacterized protein n=1 Tax=Populus alba TaxID=43335 RepID=A0ACC4BG01_POPAL
MKKFNSKLDLALLLLPVILFLQPISAIDFVFNGFNSSSVSLYGSAIIESRILTLTNQTSFEIGRALYPTKIPTKAPKSSFVYPFSTSFIFAMAPYKNVLPGHGLVFLFVPFTGIQGSSSAQNLGFLNFTNGNSSDNHMLGIEFDVFANEEFSDMNDNHVGIDVNSLTSIEAADAGYWPDNSRSSSNGNTSDEDSNSFKEQDLNNVRPTMRQVVKVMEGNNELGEIESEDMDTCLLQQMKSKDFWSSYSQSSSHGLHPTFDEIRRYNSSSMSLSWSNTVVEGRFSVASLEEAAEVGRIKIQ